MTTYGFNENDAKRVGRVVRQAERGPQKIVLGGPNPDGAAPGVRLLIAKHEGTAWETAQTAVVIVYNGDPGDVSSQLTLVAYNEYMHFGTHEVCTVRYLSLGHNGFNWHPVDFHSDDDDCVSAVGGVDFTYFEDFEKTAIQILGHDAGCVKWFNVFQCPSTAS